MSYAAPTGVHVRAPSGKQPLQRKTTVKSVVDSDVPSSPLLVGSRQNVVMEGRFVSAFGFASELVRRRRAFSHTVRRSWAKMGCLCGCGGGGRRLRSKALPCALLVTYCLLAMATPVAAPLVANVSRSVSSAVEKPLLTEEAIALQAIARALNRSVKLSSIWSWIQVLLVPLCLILTGVTKSYLVDHGRKRRSHWKSLRPSPLEDVLTPLTRQLLTELTALKVQLAPALDRMAMTTAYAWRQLEEQLEANANEVADLQAQLAAALDRMSTTAADAERKEEETNRKFEWLQARFHSLNTNRKEYYHEFLWPRVETEPEREGKEAAIVAYASRRAAGFLSD